jgi:hypothetical protein
LLLVGKVGVLITQVLLTPVRERKREKEREEKKFSKHKINIHCFYPPSPPFSLRSLSCLLNPSALPIVDVENSWRDEVCFNIPVI